MIIVITLIAAIGVTAFSIITLTLPTETSPLPNKFTPSALMLINNESSGASRLNMNSMEGLAALAGLNLPVSANYSDLAVFIFETNSLLDSVVDKFDLIERYEIEEYPRASSRKKLKKFLRAKYDEKSGVLSVSFTDVDPFFAKDVLDYCVVYLGNRFDELGLDKNRIEKENLETNIASTFEEIERLEEETRTLEQSVASDFLRGRRPAITRSISLISMELEAKRQVYTQLKVQYELLKITMASARPVFQILEMAEAPDAKSEPSRGLLCVIVVFAAGFLASSWAFVLDAISNIKNDPEAMAKLRRNKKK
jgi:uncharacterized protein involved in exopolysaccharide biosynthesis